MSATPVATGTRSDARTFLFITVVGGVCAFLLAPQAPFGERLWPAMLQLDPAPVGAQVGLFMLLGAIESLAFGAGLAVLLAGGEPVRRVFGAQHARLAAATHLSLFWLLWSWWLHVGMHMTSGMRAGRVLFIEYAFHVTSILAGAVLAYAVLVLGRRATGTSDR